MEKIIKKYLALLISLMMVLMTGCQTYDNFVAAWITHTAVERSVIRIGVYEPLTGDAKAYGELERKGIELARELYPVILGKEVELVYGDNQGDVFVGETVAKDLVEKNVSVVLGSYGSLNSLVGAPIFEEAQIPAIAITNINPMVTSHNPFYARVGFVESFQGVALAKYTVEQLHLQEAGILAPTGDDRAQAVSKAFADKLAQLGGTVILTVEFPTGETDFTPYLQRIKERNIRVCFVPAGIKDSVQLIKQAKNTGLNCIFLGTNDWEEEDFLHQLGAEGTNIIAFSSLFDEAIGTSETEKFMKAYKEKYGPEAVPERATVLAYDAYLLARGAMMKAGTATRGELIMEQLIKNREFEGASGSITFNEIGDPTKPVAIKTIRNDEFATIYTVVPKWGYGPDENEEIEE